MTDPIRYAIHDKTKKIVYIKNADNGLSCNCKCLECDERLEAVQGQIREWYFRHNKNINCKGGQETAIHKLAKQIIVDNSQIVIPGDTLFYSQPRQEERFSSIIPDVTVLANGQTIHFEIAVTHPVESLNETFYKNGQHKSIEIDLTNISYDIEPQELEKLILHQVENKRKIYWEQKLVTQPIHSNSNNGWAKIFAFLAFVAGLFIFRQLFTKRTSNKIK